MTKVRVKPTRPAKTAVVFELFDNETRGGGIGGWESIERPRDTAATAWVATPPKTLELPLQLEGRDGAGPGRDQVVEGLCRQVERWGSPTQKTGEPPVLQVAGLPRVDKSDRWVLQDITWGEYVVNAGGQRVYQQLTLSLLEFSKAELVKSPAKKARKRQRGGKGNGGRPEVADGTGRYVGSTWGQQ